MDTKKRFLNKVQNLNRRETAGIAGVAAVTVLVLYIMSAVSSSEVHTSLNEKIELVNTTQAIEIEALRKKFEDYQQQTEAKFELMLSMHNKSNAIDSLNTTVTEALASISEHNRKSELQFTIVNDTIQSGLKELEVSTRENITKASKISGSSDSFHQLANNATRLVKRVDELKKEKSDTDKKVGMNITELSQRMETTEHNTKDSRKRFERVDKELEKLATKIDTQNGEIEVKK